MKSPISFSKRFGSHLESLEITWDMVQKKKVKKTLTEILSKYKHNIIIKFFEILYLKIDVLWILHPSLHVVSRVNSNPFHRYKLVCNNVDFFLFISFFSDSPINRKCQLKELSIPRIYAVTSWTLDSLRTAMVASLAKFLRTQHSLQKFDMSNAELSINDGIKLLDALVTGLRGRRTLKVLNLECFFDYEFAIFGVAKFLHFLNNINQLKELWISYNCLSNDVIKILTRTCSASLRVFKLMVTTYEPHDEEIDAEV